VTFRDSWTRESLVFLWMLVFQFEYFDSVEQDRRNSRCARRVGCGLGTRFYNFPSRGNIILARNPLSSSGPRWWIKSRYTNSWPGLVSFLGQSLSSKRNNQDNPTSKERGNWGVQAPPVRGKDTSAFYPPLCKQDPLKEELWIQVQKNATAWKHHILGLVLVP